MNNATINDTQATPQDHPRHRLAHTQCAALQKAIKRCPPPRGFPRLGSPRHALHVLVANLGGPKEALEAGAASKDWLHLDLQYKKEEDERL